MSITYAWTSLSAPGIPGSTINVGNLTFSDAAVAAGSFSMSEFCTNPSSASSCFIVSGDPTQIHYLPNADPIGLVSFPYQFSVSVSFNQDHSLSGHFAYDDAYTNVDISGAGSLWSGPIQADWLQIAGANNITGYFSAGPIPEPASLLLVASLIGAAMLARVWRAS